jgi:hypothetical protein
MNGYFPFPFSLFPFPLKQRLKPVNQGVNCESSDR